MSMNKIILFTVAVNFIAIGLSQITNADELVAEKLLGEWYTVAMVNPNLAKIKVSCDRRSVTMGDDNKLNIVDSAELNGNFQKYEGTGEVVGSEIHTNYPVFGAAEDVTSVKSYSDGQELILHDQVDKKHYMLQSRKPTASDEVNKIFEDEAAAAGLTVTYIDQSNCGDN